ncbi:lactosylceramide 1,3-N-acetyl-beta-D-glucosaminyltransferase-like [Planococcus citri]|uniref:lactosylceramide 1,3-N-acetyl-beta-D-glucosaminyltransferase-like n=1 Tax=Planococcus citri TaxID=170843 RepID=UPI0031F8C3F3
MNLKLFRINRRILTICKISLCVFCFSVIFYFDVPIYLLYRKIYLSKGNSNGGEIYKPNGKIHKPTPKFHRIHQQFNSEEYHTFKSLEEERREYQEFQRIRAEHLKLIRLDRLAKHPFEAENAEDYSSDDDDDDDDEEDEDDDANNDEVVIQYLYKSNNEEIEEIDTKEIEYQLEGEKLPSVVLPPGLLQWGRLYSLFHYLKPSIPENEREPIGWEKNVSRRAIDYINQNYDTSFTHFSKDICIVRQPQILIIICSRPRNVFLRQSIRLTWARWADQYNITILFLMGYPVDNRLDAKLLEESNLRRDLILEGFDDTYNNLTLKTIFMLKWVQMYCAEVPFVLKLDDDVYVNLENLHNYVMKIQKNDLSKLLVGKVEPNAKPYRDLTNKWYMPYYLYKSEQYPNYTQGVAYLMSKQVASKLYEYSLTKEFLHLEDVFLTGICAQELDITPIDQEEFRFTKEPQIGCHDELFPKLAIVSHHVKVLDMYKIHYRALSCSVISF